jgi:uncharacterized OB-fold protein
MTTSTEVRPIKSFVKLPPGDKPYLAGLVCKGCGEVLIGGAQRLACPKCASRAGFNEIKLAATGTVFVFTTVERSYPGVATPFISVIVDLDGGGTLKGNLRNVKPDQVQFGMPVKVVFDTAARTDKQNNSYISYFFEPVAEGARA